jgi:hypothetical protein
VGLDVDWTESSQSRRRRVPDEVDAAPGRALTRNGGVDGTRNPKEKHHVAARRDGWCENTMGGSEPSATAYQGDAWRTGPDARELRRRLLDVLRMLDDG